jgi:hypothetical protein
MEQELRSPTLETIKMVEQVINDNSGEFNKTRLWEKLPRKIMWPTFTTIINYLKEINKIIISDNGVITWIWNPELAERLESRKSLHFDNVKK